VALEELAVRPVDLPVRQRDDPSGLTRVASGEWQVMDRDDDEWGRKGATLSDRTARSEYGLTQDEIYDAIDAGKLQYRRVGMQGNPWLRLLRREVEELARNLDGERDFRERQARTELVWINRELKRIRAQRVALEQRRAALLSERGEQG
jgi:hypothetical protein